MVQKLLDELVRDGTLNVQEYGKAKIYYANQVRLPVRDTRYYTPWTGFSMLGYAATSTFAIPTDALSDSS